MATTHQFIITLAVLEDLVRQDHLQTLPPHYLRFSFEPAMIVDGELMEWQATITLDRGVWVEYGNSIEHASARLLNMIHHPEEYPQPDDD